MTHWTEAADMLDERNSARPGFVARYAPGAFAFLTSAALGVYLVLLRPVVFAPTPVAPEPPPVKADAFGALAPVGAPASVALSAKPQSNPFGRLETQGFDAPSQFSLSEAPSPLPPVAPADLRPPAADDAAPLPPRRPSELARAPEPGRALPAPPRASDSLARLEPRPAVAAPNPAGTPSLFEKLFGGAAGAPSRTAEPRMAYAAPPPVSGVSAMVGGRGGAPAPAGFGGFLRGLNVGSSPTARYGERVAVYDISAHVVYMPDGTRLEAHSGLGEARDDPNSVHVRMRGPTPPATYALTPREALFHGVEALRLTPVDSSVFGRAGLLAHTYMLGAEGDSNGCVSFRDYDAFLRAYRNGQINKLVVVTRL